MISWIQKYFQHHFRAIFAVLLALTIISFVFTIGASPGLSRAERQSLERSFFGHNLASQEDMGKVLGDASLSAQLQAGFNYLEGEQLQNYAFQRVAALHLADQFHIPATSKQEIADYIKTLRIFAGEDGQFDAKRYTAFRDSLKTNPRMTESAVSRVLGDDVRSEKVQKLLGGPGYVLPADVASQLARADSKWTLGTATVDYASFKPTINPSEADLAKFFGENTFRYEVPPRVVVQYADFPAQAYLANIQISEADARSYYDANPDQFPQPAADPKNPAPADANAKFTAVRAQVESALRLEQARRLAAKDASDLSYALYEGKVTPGTTAFDQLLASRKISLKTLAPFTQRDGPTEFGGSRDLATEAFKLGTSRSYSDAVTVSTGAVVLFWKELQPAYAPGLAEVRQKVTSDYNENEKRKRFVELGRTLRTQIETRLKAGDNFEKAASTAADTAGVKITAKMFEPFTRRQPPQDLDQSVAGILDRLDKGQVSDMSILADKGILAYAADRHAPDLTEANPGFTAMRNQVAATNGRMSAGAYLREIVEQELKRTEPAKK